MTGTKTTDHNSKDKHQRIIRNVVGGIVKIMLCLLILGVAIAAYRYQIKTSPRALRQKPARQAKLVQVIPVQKGNFATTIKAMGTVVPAQKVTLRPQVTGQVMMISEQVVPGGIVQANQKLMEIDRRDYEILLEQRQSDVTRVIRDLKIEQGNQAVAKQEYELLGEVIRQEDRELVLREPQLASVQSALESARAALRKAELDLERCDIVSPFNAVIQDKHIDLGSTVTANSELLTFIGTDEAWIEVMLPVHQLKWINIPQQNGQVGSSVKITNRGAWGNGIYMKGRVVRLYGELESQGRMAQLLVTVDDPFCLKPENQNKPRLLMESYVSTEIEGRTLTSVFRIDQSYIRDNNTVWIMDDNGSLAIRPVKIVYRGPDQVYVNEGLTETDKLVITDIAAPVEGMLLRVAQAEDQDSLNALEPADGGGERP